MIIHVVQPGETIAAIAALYGVSEARIISDNGILNPRALPVGQALLILRIAESYTVAAGDTLEGIAAKFGIEPLTLLQNNPAFINTPYLQAGQKLAIRFDTEKKRTVVLNGYAYPYIRQDILAHAVTYLSYLTIFGYGFSEQGDLLMIEDEPLIRTAYQYRCAPIMLFTSFTEEGRFSTQRASRLFQDAGLQNKVIDQIIATMQRKGYVGLDVDFEFIEAKDAAAYLDFLRRVSERLHTYGYFVNTDLAPKTSADQAGLLYESHDYGAIGAISDRVLLMTYEWGYVYGPPMAVAPLNQVRRVVEYALSEIPADKIYLGIPNYAYDWPLPFERGVTAATSIGNEYAVQIAARYQVPIEYDQNAQSPHFRYRADSGREHVVWFEDVRSIQAKFSLMDEYALRGAGYWNVMRPFAQNWAFVNAQYQIDKVAGS